MSLDLTDEKSTLVQVMALFCEAISHCLILNKDNQEETNFAFKQIWIMISNDKSLFFHESIYSELGISVHTLADFRSIILIVVKVKTNAQGSASVSRNNVLFMCVSLNVNAQLIIIVRIWDSWVMGLWSWKYYQWMAWHKTAVTPVALAMELLQACSKPSNGDRL